MPAMPGRSQESYLRVMVLSLFYGGGAPLGGLFVDRRQVMARLLHHLDNAVEADRWRPSEEGCVGVAVEARGRRHEALRSMQRVSAPARTLPDRKGESGWCSSPSQPEYSIRAGFRRRAGWRLRRP